MTWWFAVALGLITAMSAAASGWAWRADRRHQPESGWRGRLALAAFPFANRGQPAMTLVLFDAFVLFFALAVEDSVDGGLARVARATATVTAVALVPLAVLVATTLRFGQPAFLVPPWARGKGR